MAGDTDANPPMSGVVHPSRIPSLQRVILASEHVGIDSPDPEKGIRRDHEMKDEVEMRWRASCA